METERITAAEAAAAAAAGAFSRIAVRFEFAIRAGNSRLRHPQSAIRALLTKENASGLCDHNITSIIIMLFGIIRDSRMNHYCCVPRCSSWIKRDPQLTFKTFPEQGKHQVSLINKFGQKERIDRRKAWILKLRIGKPASKLMKRYLL
ncbi:hypothetical protein NQ318_020852 [Aromia moschata]|uniref:Uncharacterized protein n=1 Tax=Aromia moschata TaxID=1265417 RepID=A0AAV8XI14_9CUCU|nr:hypothetical protein NQ318_020852 [Aromia moschata]